MLKSGQFLGQKLSQQQKLSPQQIQFINLLQLPTVAMELRIKEEIEQNPLLEDISDSAEEFDSLSDEDSDTTPSDDDRTASDTDPVDSNSEIDWDSILHNTDFEGKTYAQRGDNTEWMDLPKPYHRTILENLEQQVALLNLSEPESLIAEEIIGSLDEDGYLQRELQAIVDSIVFNTGVMVYRADAERVLQKIQKLDPPGIAARDLRECLRVQLEMKSAKEPGRSDALRILATEWDAFSKKHFDKIMKRLDLSAEELKIAYDCIQHLDPKPGKSEDTSSGSGYIIPDFEVIYVPDAGETTEFPFKITLNHRNLPAVRISPSYKRMWDDLQHKEATSKDDKETQAFIKSKMESAKAFIEVISQRSNTLLSVMRTIVELQQKFFRTGATLRPMILKDVADRINMDISTVSRVVNGKYVQTKFGVYELKYFFNEGIETEDGESASNRDVKNLIESLIENEPPDKPLTDDKLVELIKEKGYIVARRTVSKYREQLGIPVARLRKSL